MTASIELRLDLNRKDFRLRVDTTLPCQGVTAIFGPSGSGKTTLLRCIAGLDRNAHGTVRFKEDLWQSEQRFVPTYKRPLGYVFQEASLFPHLNARDNLAFAKKRAGSQSQYISEDEAITLLGIGDLLHRFPHQLSGGERQRVAIARALIINPQLLMMDEPLASLDTARKQEILPYLDSLKKALSLPILYVTHSPDEIARLADQLLVLNKGQVVASGKVNEALANLDLPIKLGEDSGVVLEGAITAKDNDWHLAKIDLSQGELWFRDNGYSTGETVRVRVLARDVSLTLDHQAGSSIINALPAEVLAFKQDNHPALTLVQIKVGEHILLARVSSRSVERLKLTPGLHLWAQIKSVAIDR